MTTVLERLAALNEASQVCLQQAVPLETAWRLRKLDQDEWEHSRRGTDSQVERPTEREKQLAARRARALQLLYERELGFEPLADSWMARMMEPPF